MTDELSLFMQYAQAFEEAYATDDWGIVGTHFDDNIIWTTAGLPSSMNYQGRGRKHTADAIKRSVDTLDRHFATRAPQITQGPVSIPSGIHFQFLVTYTKDGLPPLLLRGEEWDLFQDGKLAMHYERIHNGQEISDYVTRHGALLASRN